LRILVNENIPKATVRALRELGHDVLDIRGTENEGACDSAVWKIAQGDQRLIVTTDKWFGTTRDLPHFGALIVLLNHPNLQRIHERILLALASYPENSWPEHVVVMRDNVRSVRRVR
jgi:predicted nuclease of predicted toxin-antitoxin system